MRYLAVMTDEMVRLRGLVETFYFDVWNRGDEEAAHRILSSDLEFRGSTGPTKQGVDQFLGYVRLIRGALSGYECVIEDTVVEPPKLFAKMLFRGTHAGQFFGVPEVTAGPVSLSRNICAASISTIEELPELPPATMSGTSFCPLLASARATSMAT